jgi:hypothetical protein
MKQFVIFTTLFITLIPTIFAQVVIQEVLYDPASESGGEAVLLQNKGTTTVDISGWALATEASLTDATVPPGSVLSPGTTYLLTDVGWEALRGELPSAQHEESMTLANTDAGVGLKNAEGVIVDAVGWGVASGIKAELFEGTPHLGAEPLQSLRRTQDTNNNANDFVAGTPVFGSVAGGGFEVPIELDVNDTAVIDEASITKTVTITPGVGADIFVTVDTLMPATVLVTFLDDVIDLHASATDTYDATITIPFTTAPGNYTATITATNGEKTETRMLKVEIMPVMGVSLDTALLALKVSPGGTLVLEGDEDTTTPDKPTVRNIGNVPVDIGLSVKLNTDAVITTVLSKTHLGVGDVAGLWLNASIPAGIARGKYVGALVFDVS